MKKRNIFWAVILIFIAVYLVVSKMHMIPAIPFFKILFTVIFVYTAVYGFVRLHFFEGMLSVGLLGCMYDKVLGIQAITPWTLLLAACLVGLALDLLFRNLKKQKDNTYFGHSSAGGHVENGQDGEYVHVENSFGALSKYVNSDCFREAKISNSFGECNVFFNNTALKGANAIIRTDNSFGSTNIYLPSTWRVKFRQNTAFGNVECKGQGSSDPDAPCVELQISSSFGQTCIIFG